MRKIIYICSLLFLFAIATYAQNTSVTIGSVTAPSPGQRFSVPVDVSNFNGMLAITLAIQYNQGSVRFDSVSRQGEFFAGTPTPGQITITRASLSPVTPANGRLLDLHFTYLGGSTELNFNTALCELVNSNGTVTGVQYNNGNVFPSTALSVKIDSVQNPAVNSEIAVPVTVSSFNNIGAVTLKIQYDPAVVQFDSVSRSNEFLAGAGNGVLTISRASLQAVTPVNGKLLDVYFKYLGGNTALTFDEANSEIADLTLGPVGVNYIDGGVFNPASQISVSLANVTDVSVGSEAAVALNVDNFTNIGAVTLKIQYNPDAVQFDSVSRSSEFLTGASNGVITISRASLTAVTPDSGKVLDLYFKYLGGSSDLTFDENESEITDLTTGPVTGVVYENGSISGVPGTEVSVSLANVLAGNSGSTVTVPLTVDNFTNIGAVTLKIQFDPAVASFDSTSRSGEFLSGVSGGLITISRSSLTPVTPDSGKVLDLYFTYVAGSTALTFDAAASEITDLTTGPLPNVVYGNGSITSDPDHLVTVELGTVAAGAVNSTVTVPVNVDNFTNIGAVTLKIQYDPAVAQFDSVSNDEFFSGAQNGVITLTRASLTPVAPDSGKILDLYFKYLGGSTSLTVIEGESEITNLTTGVIAGVNYVDGAITNPSAIRVELDSVKANVNSSVAVPLDVANFNNIGAVTLKIQFNPAVAHFDSISRSNEFLSGVTGDIITISRASLTPVTPAEGNLLNLYFTFLGGNTDLTFTAESEITDLTTGPLTGVLYVNGNIASNSLPIFSAAMPDVSVNEDDTLSFDYNAEDLDGDPVSFALVAPAPAGAAINAATGELTWVPTFAQAGTYNFVVSATSGTDVVRDTAVVTVLNVNRAPEFVNTLGPTMDVFYPVPGDTTFQYTAEDADGDSLVFQLINAPAGASITESGLFTFTASVLTVGLEITVVVSDTAGAADTSVTVIDVLDGVINPGLLPTEYSLKQNFPNPFNPSTMIRFDLPSESYVTLKIFNLLGEEVKTMVNEVLSAGYHEYKFDASSLSTGIYIYRIQAGDFISTKKMTLIK